MYIPKIELAADAIAGFARRHGYHNLGLNYQQLVRAMTLAQVKLNEEQLKLNEEQGKEDAA